MSGERRARTSLFGRGRRLVGLLLILALAAGAGVWAYGAPGPAARTGADTNIVLPHGSGLLQIGAALQQAGLIGSAPVFDVLAVLGGARRLEAGEYDFPSHASIADILDKLRNGKVVQHSVTIAEGLTSQEAVDVLAAEPVLVGQVQTPPEGAILPETYSVARGETREAVLHRMMAARDKLLAALWAARSPGLPYRTPEEAATLASIVEKETAIPAERPRIAGLFVNRLKKGMRLESDPTIIYGLSKGRPLGHGIRQSEMTTPTPWNTYLIAGLPPSPIANPGKDALAAALHPADTQALYFVADGSGGHVFADTFDEHKRNVQRWRKVEAEQQKTGRS